MAAKLVNSGGVVVKVAGLKYGQVVKWLGQLCLATYEGDTGGVMLVSLENPNHTWTGVGDQIVTALPKGTEVLVTAE
jgi:hypothetical protein